MKRYLLLALFGAVISASIFSGCGSIFPPDETVTPTPTATVEVGDNNPAIKEPLHYNADPAARQWTPGGPIYVYGTYDTTGDNYETEWRVFSSKDLVNWTDHGKALSLEDNIADEDDQYEVKWAAYHAWAPDCHEKNGKYYFYYPASNKDIKDVVKPDSINNYMYTGVAVGDSPIGPFKDALGEPLIQAHDPAILKDTDGKYYLYGDNHVVQLGEDMISLAEEPKVIQYEGADNPITYDDGKITTFEAVYAFKRNGIYYWTCSLGFNTLIYYTGTSPYGPFTYRGIIMQSDGTARNNHHSIVEYEGRWLLFYHKWITKPVNQKARRTCIEYLNFNEDGTIQEVTRTEKGVSFPYPSN